MKDFTKCAVGTTVYSLNLGEGKITEISEREYPVTVEFKESKVDSFTADGRLVSDDEGPTLFLRKPKIIFEEIPEKQFYVGDKVKIVSKEATEKSVLLWTNSMDECLGKTGEVIKNETGIRVYIEGGGTWNFHPSDLEQVSHEFKKDDWVVPTGRKTGIPGWNLDGLMDALIGKAIKVRSICEYICTGLPAKGMWAWNPLELRPAKTEEIPNKKKAFKVGDKVKLVSLEKSEEGNWAEDSDDYLIGKVMTVKGFDPKDNTVYCEYSDEEGDENIDWFAAEDFEIITEGEKTFKPGDKVKLISLSASEKKGWSQSKYAWLIGRPMEVLEIDTEDNSANCRYDKEDYSGKGISWFKNEDLEIITEGEKTMNYVQLKPITAAALIEQNVIQNDLIKVLNKFGYGPYDFEELMTFAEEQGECWPNWLIRKGFAKRNEPDKVNWKELGLRIEFNENGLVDIRCSDPGMYLIRLLSNGKFRRHIGVTSKLPIPKDDKGRMIEVE